VQIEDLLSVNTTLQLETFSPLFNTTACHHRRHHHHHHHSPSPSASPSASASATPRIERRAADLSNFFRQPDESGNNFPPPPIPGLEVSRRMPSRARVEMEGCPLTCTPSAPYYLCC
jgi:hypothetical protein